jgi:Protein of unknown function (DUF3158)
MNEAVTSPRPRFFDPLQSADFLRLEHAHYAKGLLRPFKGKGELTQWAIQCQDLRRGLVALAERLLAQATVYPLSLLPVVMAQQSTGAGTAFLRWRTADRASMGVALWASVMRSPTTPLPLVHELYALELQRIALNMQISLTHTLARQALECAGKMGEADTIYQQRLFQNANRTS